MVRPEQADIDALRHLKVARQKLFINGQYCEGNGGEADVFSPIDGKKITTLSVGSKEDVDKAVAAARASFEKGHWSKAAPAQRKKTLLRVAELIEENMLALAVLGVRDNGTEISMALKSEPGSAAASFRYYGEAIDKIYGQVAATDPSILGMVLREPVGVVGAIIPWNFPMMIGAWKIAAALAAGNSVVLKPSETASLTLLRLGEFFQQAGLPEGVFNIITGDGKISGAAMAAHIDIDVIGFTGSGATGRLLMQGAAKSNMKRLYLELGGKSPNIIFADTKDLDMAAKIAAMGIFRNSGETCVAASRLLVERSIVDSFTQAVITQAQKLKIGDPLDLKNDVGAVTSKAQLESDLDFIKRAQQQGADLRFGGKQINQDSGGYYMQPTIFCDVTPKMDIFCNEIFGPVLTITSFDSEDEAIALANQTIYGLSSGVWTTDLSRAHRMVRALKAGIVHVNCYGGAEMTMPLAGVKQSGNGADKSLHALDQYTDLKTVWIKI